MTDFNPTAAVKDLKDAAKKAEELSSKWAKSASTKGAVKTFMADNKSFFKTASNVMSVLSVGCSVADSFGLFGESEHKEVMKQLAVIDKKIDELSGDMKRGFENLTTQIDYNTVTAILAANETDILTQLDHRNYYLEQLNKSDQRYKTDARDTLLKSSDNLDKDIVAYYEAFTKTDPARNILDAIYNHYAGAPGPLINKGYEMIYLVQEAAKIIGLKHRLRKEKKEGANFDLQQCLNSVEEEFTLLYEPKITKMINELEVRILKALDNIEANIPKYYEKYLKGHLRKGDPTPSNTSTLCARLEENFPMACFMAIEYANCSGNSEHVDGLRASRAITQYHLKEIDRNLLIWWQWCAEPDAYSASNLNARAIATRNNEVAALANMPEYTTYKEYADMRTYVKKNYDIPEVIQSKFNKDLFHYSAGAHALVIRKTKAGRVNWAHSANCFPLAMAILDQGFYDVFWMILDV